MNGVQRAGVFSTCGMGVDSCAFLKRVGEILVHLGFLQVWDLICKRGCADWQPGSCHPRLLSDVTAVLPTSSSHFPENQWQLQWPVWGSYGTVPSVTHSMVRSQKGSLKHVSKGQSKDLGSSPASLSFLAEAHEHQVALLCEGTVV